MNEVCKVLFLGRFVPSKSYAMLMQNIFELLPELSIPEDYSVSFYDHMVYSNGRQVNQIQIFVRNVQATLDLKRVSQQVVGMLLWKVKRTYSIEVNIVSMDTPRISYYTIIQ